MFIKNIEIMNKSAMFRLKLSFPNVSAWPFISGITSSVKPLQGLIYGVYKFCNGFNELVIPLRVRN